MKATPLTESISAQLPCARMLISRRGFFFDPPTDLNGNQGGSPGAGNPNPGGSGDFPGQQPPGQPGQQQQQPPDFVSPFTGIDRSLLDDSTRQAIDKAEADMRNLHGRANTASQLQSDRDRLQAQATRYEATLQQLQRQNRQQPGQQQQPQEPLTVEQELERILLDEGFSPDAAKRTAAVQAKIAGVVGKRHMDQVGQRFAPLAQQVINSGVSDAFEQIKANDAMGMMDIPDVAQKTWEQLDALAGQGQMISPDMAANLAKIHYMDYCIANGIQPGQIPTRQPQHQSAMFPVTPQLPPNNSTTRFTYPGANAQNHARLPVNPQQQQQMDPEVFAAMAATTSGWSVTPEAFKGKTNGNKVHVTRGN